MDLLYPRPLAVDEIRLVQVHPLPFSSNPPLSLTLHTFRNSKAPPYTALSYTWGNPEDVATAIINGVGMYITHNLACALSQFRLDITAEEHDGADRSSDGGNAWPSRFIWVDALSINQASEAEKSAQVARILAIYSQAACILAFLGDDTPRHSENSEIALAKIHNIMARYYSAVPNASLTSPIPPWAPEILADDFAVCGDENDDLIWGAVQELYGRPWWSRLWVLAEATTARPTWLVVGGIKTSFSDVVVFAMLMALAPLPAHESAFAVYPISSFVYGLKDLLDKRLGGSAEDPEPGLLDVLGACRHFGAADPRDKVYGALSFVSPKKSKGLVVNYSKDIIGVYTDVVRAHIRTSHYGNKLDFLAADGLPEGGMTGLPSWLPDWRHQEQFQVAFQKYFTDLAVTPRPEDNKHHRDTSRPAYRASGSEDDLDALGIPPKHLIVISDRTLRVKGFRVGYLYDMQRPLDPSDNPSHQHAVLSQWHATIPTGPTATYFTGESEMEAFTQCICAGLAFQGHEPLCRTPTLETSNHRDVFRMPRGEAVRMACTGRRLARVVQKGWSGDAVALVAAGAREGDQVWVVLGGQMMYVMRPAGGGGWRFVGEAYVHGMMDGEALDLVRQGLERVQEVVMR